MGLSAPYMTVDDMTTTLQYLHMNDQLTHDDEGVDENGPNYIEYVRMLPDQTNDDFTIGGSSDLQQRICTQLTEYATNGYFQLRARQCDGT